MKKFTFLSLVLALSFTFLSFNAFSQTGTGSWDYTLSTSASSPVDMTGATYFAEGDDDVVRTGTFPFAFQVYDDIFSTSDIFRLGSNGFVGFEVPINGTGAFGNNTRYITGIPSNYTQNQYAKGEFLSYGGHGDGEIFDTIWQKTTGTAPNQVYTLEFVFRPYYNNSAYEPTIQISFYQTTNVITVNYINTTGSQTTGTGAHLGINCGDAVFGTHAGSMPSADTKITYTPGAGTAEPQSLTATKISSEQINLAWALNAASNDVIITYNTSNTFTAPSPGTSYTTGNEIAAGQGRVLYQGSLTAFNHTALAPNQIYYYRAWSKTSTNLYSSLYKAANATTDPVVDPTSFTATGISASQINLAWVLNSAGDDVIVTWNTSNSFTAPTYPNSYTVGTQIAPGLGTVLYKGTGTSTSHSSLSTNATYYYKVWSFNGQNYYSSPGVTANATTSSTGNPATFTSTATTTCNINLAWTKNTSSNDVMVVYNTTNNFTTPTTGQTYNTGYNFAQGTVLYAGSNLSASHTPILDNTTYYYKAYSFDASKNYSSGSITNATTALIADPTAFAAVSAGSNQLNLSWTKNTASDDVIVLHNTSNTFGTLSDGTTYTVGTVIGGGGSVLYIGSASAYAHSGLGINSTHYYKISSYDCANNYSGGSTANGTTGGVSNPQSLSFTGASSCSVDMAWQKNAASNDVMIAFNYANVFGTPINGVPYTVGNSFPGGQGTIVYVGSLTSFTHSPLFKSTGYYYKVWSKDGSANYSAGITGDTATNAVGAPTGLSATSAGTSQINLAWTLNSASDSVMVAWSSNGGFQTPIDGVDYTVGNTIQGQGTVLYKGLAANFNHTGLTFNTSYYYKVWSYDCGKNYSTTGATANATTDNIDDPSGFTATVATTSQINLAWTKNTANDDVIITYNLTGTFSNPVNGTPYSVGGTIGTDAVIYKGSLAAFNHTGLSTNTTYYYKVWSVNSSNYYSNGLTDNATTGGINDPVSFSATAVSASSIILAWVANNNSDSVMITYNTVDVFAQPQDGVNYPIGNQVQSGQGFVLYRGSAINPTSYTHVGLNANTMYYYTIWSYDNSSNYYSSPGIKDSAATNFPGIATFPNIEDFETQTPATGNPSCSGTYYLTTNWVNVTGDNKDWIPRTGATPYTSTGPDGDNTTAAGTGKYIYAGGYGGGYCTNQTAWLVSPLYNFTNLTNPKLEFYYHMYGSTMGKLSVQVSTNGGNTWSSDLWYKQGQQHTSASTAYSIVDLSLSAYAGMSNIKIRITSLSGSSWRSDMAVDDIKVYEPQNMTVTSVTTEQDTLPVVVGATNQGIIRVKVITVGAYSPLTLAQIGIGTSGTTALSDIHNAKIYYTGNNPNFTATQQFGSTIATPTSSFPVVGARVLAEGVNYFWLSYDIQSYAVIGNYVDASCSVVTISGTNHTPTVTSPPQVKKIVGQVTVGTGTAAHWNGPTFPAYYGGAHESIFLSSEIGTGPKEINKIEWHKSSGNNITNQITQITVYLKNTTTTSLSSGAYSTSGYTQVYQGPMPNTVVTGWLGFNLDNTFLYNGVGNIQMLVVQTKPGSSWSQYPYWSYTTVTPNKARRAYSSSGTVSNLTSTNRRPNTRFEYVLPQPMVYLSSTTEQPITANVGLGDTNKEIIRVKVATQYTGNALSFTSLSFNTSGSTSAADITNAKVYFTGTNGNLSTSNQFGSTVSNPSGAFTVTGTQTLSAGDNYFWLVYDISSSATVNNVVDATCTSLTVGGVAKTPSITAPSGNRKIKQYIIIGTGTATNFAQPLHYRNYHAWEGIYLSSEVGAAKDISAIAFYKGSGVNVTNDILNVSIYMKHTSSSSVGTGAYSTTGYTQVYQGNFPNNATTGWMEVAFNTGTDFAYNGTDNVEVLIVQSYGNYFSGYPYWRYRTVSPNRARFANSWSAAPTTLSASNRLANIRFEHAPPQPMSFVSSTTIQNNITNIIAGVADQEIIGVKVVTLNSSNALNTTSFTFNTTGCTNPNGDITNAKVFYTGNTSTFAATNQFGTAVANPNGTFTVTGTQALTSGDNYFWLAYDLPTTATTGNWVDAQCTAVTVGGSVRTPTITSPLGNRAIVGALSGYYTIGASGDYSTFNAAISALNTYGISGWVTFGVQSGTYNEKLVLGVVTNASAARPITFESVTGDSTDVILTYSASQYNNAATVKFDGGDYFVFQNMTIKGTGTYGHAIEVSGGADHNIVRNNVLITTSTNYTYGAVVFSYPGANSNITIAQNNIQGIGSGFYLRGSGSGSYVSGWDIDSNIVTVQRYGAYMYYSSDMKFRGNQFNVGTGGTTGYGLYLYYGSYPFEISGNKFITTASTTAYGAYIRNTPGVSSNRIKVFNNFFANTTNATSASVGLYTRSSNYVDVYYNNFNITATSGTTRAGLYTYLGNNVRVQNNNFISPGGAFAQYYYNSSTVISSDYNNMVSTGNIGYYNGSNVASLAAWKTATSKDANSVSINPNYVSTTDLHITNNALDNLASPITGITIDIDGGARHSTTPDIGADEFGNDIDAGITSITNPTSPLCGSGNQSVKVDLKNFGNNTLTSVTVNWKVGGVAQTAFAWSGTLASGATQNITIGTFNFNVGTHLVETWTSNPNSQTDQYPANDSADVTIIVGDTPSANAGGDSTVCASSFTTINASAANYTTLLWTTSGSGTFANGASVIDTYTPSAADYTAGSVYLKITASTTSCGSAEDSLLLTISQPPTVTFTGLATQYCANDEVDTLIGTPIGGTFSGPGMTGQFFNPANANIGNNTIKYTYTSGSCTDSAVQTVAVNSVPTVSLTGLNASYCDNANTVTLIGSPAGGAFGGDGVTGTTFDPTATTSSPASVWYSYTNGSTGCSAADTNTVVIYSAPTANAGSDKTVAILGTTTLNGSASGGTSSYSYAWSPASQLVNATIQTPTTTVMILTTIFDLTVTDNGNSCTDIDQVTVTVTAPILVTQAKATPDTICLGDSTQLQAITTGGNGTYTHSWTSNPAGYASSLQNPITYPTQSAWYIVYASDGSLNYEDSVWVVVNPTPTASFVGLPSTECSNADSILLTGTPASGTFSGSGIIGNYFYPANVGGGTYPITYTVTNLYGCSNDDVQSIVVYDAPIANSGIDQSITSGASTTLNGTATSGTSSYSYSWIPAAQIASGANSATATTTALTSSTIYVLTVTDNGNSCTDDDDMIVNVGNTLAATATATPDTICSGSSAQLNVIAGGGSGTYTYSWTSVPAGFTSTLVNPTVSPTITTIYNVVVNDGVTNGNASVTVVVNANPLANAGIDKSIFVGTSTTLSGSATSGSGTYNYLWSPASDIASGIATATPTTNNLSVNTTFTLTVTDAVTGCTDTDDMTVVTNITALSVTAIASPDTVCKGTNSQLTATAAGGSGTYTYSWTSTPAGFSSSIANPIVTPNATTVYNILVNDGSTTANTSITVVVDPAPIASFTGLNSDYCDNSSAVTLVGSPANGTFSGPGITGNTFTPANANIGNNQIIYAVSLGNCSDSDTQYVSINTSPIANAGSNKIITAGNSTTLNGSYTGGNNVGYFWTPAALLVNANIASPTTTTLNNSTIYTLETKDTINLCSSTDQVTVTVTNVPLSVTASATPATVCAGDTVQLQAVGTGGGTGNYAYLWSSVPAGFTATTANADAFPMVNTTYTIRIIDVTDTAYASTSVTVNPLPNVSFIGLSTDYCDNSGMVSLVGTPSGGTFSGAGITGTQFDPTQASVGTNQIVYIASVNGCTSSDTQYVDINETPTANAGTDITLTVAGSTTLNGTSTGGSNVGYFWTPISMLVNPNMAAPTTVFLTSSQTYTMEAKDTVNLCSSTDQMNVVIGGGNVSISGSATPNTICLGDTSAITTVVSGGNGIYVYTWTSSPAGFSSTQANINVSPSVTTTYTVNVVSNSTTDNASVVVTVNPLPNITFSGLTTPACAADAAMTLSGSPSGGIFTGTGVSMTSGTYIFDPISAGTGNWDVVYNYTDATTGCSNTDTQYVAVNPNPLVNAGSVQNVNGPIAVTLSGSATNAANYKYSWTPTSMVVSPTAASTPTVILTATQIFTLQVEDSITTCSASDDVTINVGSPNPVTATASATPTTICSGQSTQLNVIASGGTPPYTYSWTSMPVGFTSSIANPVVSPSNTTVYSVNVTDGTTAANSSVTIIVNATPVASFIGLDTSYCNNGIQDTLMGVPIGGFFSGFGMSANIFDPVNAGVGYHNIVYSYTGGNGCVAKDTQLTHVYAAPTANAGADFGITAPSTATLNGSASGGSNMYNYTWTPASLFTNPNLQSVTTANNLALTTWFTLEVEDQISTCRSTDDIKVTVSGGPLTLNPMATPDTICAGQQVQLSALAGGGTGTYMYAWTSIPSGYIQTIANPIAAPTVTTQYIVNVLSGVDTYSDTVLVVVGAIPSVSISATNTQYCSNGDNDTLIATPAGGVFFGNGMSGDIFYPTIAGIGTHQVVYEYTSALGCSSSDTIYAMVQTPPSADAGSDISIPCNSSGGLIGSNPLAHMTYQWSPPAGLSQPLMSNTVANPSQSTIYTIDVTDTITGCSNTDIVNVNVIGGPIVIMANDTIICGGESVTIYASGSGTSYIWSNGVASSAFTVSPMATTVYTVTVTDASACAVVDSVTVVVNAPYLFLGPDITLIDTQSVILDAGFGFADYSWSTGDTSQAIEVYAYINAQLGINKYAVEVTDIYGCKAKDSVMINYVLGLSDINNDIAFDLYPNPTKGKFTLEIEGTISQTFSLEIVNIHGQVILQKDIYVNSTDFSENLNLSTWPKGIYLIRLNNDKYMNTKKLIIQ